MTGLPTSFPTSLPTRFPAMDPDGILELEMRRRAVTQLSGAPWRLYRDLALGGRICVQRETKRVNGKLVTKEHYWAEPGGNKLSAKTARELILSGALVPLTDGLFAGLSQSFMRDRRL